MSSSERSPRSLSRSGPPKRAESQPLLAEYGTPARYDGTPTRNGRHTSVSVLDFPRRESTGTSKQNQPFFQKLFTAGHSVLNPNLSVVDLNQSVLFNQDANSVESVDLESSSGWSSTNRVNILNILRPEKLIGKFTPLTNWSDKIVDKVDAIRNKSLRDFYEEQNKLIVHYKEIDRLLDFGKVHLSMLNTYKNPLQTVREGQESTRYEDFELLQMGKSPSKSRFNDLPGNIKEGGQFMGYDNEKSNQEVLLAIMVNFFINFVLLVGKVVILFMTNSLSMVASLVDSILDFLSTFIIFIANKLSKTKNWRTQFAYPIGRTKLEPVGILIFSVIIIISFFQVGLESAKKLFLPTEQNHETAKLGVQATAVMLTTILAKIACWWWCSRSNSSSVQALAQDAETDIIFNSVSLIMPTIGHYFDIWWLDPAGALVLSLYVIISWSVTAFEHIDNLTGTSADPMDYKVVLYLAFRFAECIKQITALKVYHVGDNLNVEIDVVFNMDDFEISFKDAHDIAEALQYAIETLPMVERAFVHIDYMEGNFKGHLN